MSQSQTKRKKRKSKQSSRKRYEVDILTAVYGSPHFLRVLAFSLLEEHDAGIEFRWIIIDDATPEEKERKEVLDVLRDLKKHENVTVIESQVNNGFAKANNLAASKGRAKYILLLNSDTIVTHDGWLSKMVENVQNNPRIGVVGAKLVFFDNTGDDLTRPQNTTQHAGVGFNMLGQPYHVLLGWPVDHPKVSASRQVQAVTGACLLTTRQLWRMFKGLAEIYTIGNFEDVEYCLNCIQAGYSVYYDAEVVLRHYAGGSGNSQTAKRNHSIFQLRNNHRIIWDDWLSY